MSSTNQPVTMMTNLIRLIGYMGGLGVAQIWRRYPHWVSTNIFNQWCEANGINPFKKCGKRTRKRIIKNFKCFMRSRTHERPYVKHTISAPDLNISSYNLRQYTKINNARVGVYKFNVVVTVTMCDGSTIEYEVTNSTTQMRTVFS
ncbi:hypothetical protein N9T73_00350, partial [bacterium]|nr:hypothetical protein [bacterium]